jgi:hypothetical protein|tara:strand:- start:5 stop:658 length:654 start_codon:yes stop_codon:yes gene_type:complete
MKKVLLVLLATSVLTSCGYIEDARLIKAEKIEALRIKDSISSAKVASEMKARELEKAEAKAKKEKAIDSLKSNFDIEIDEFTGIGWVEPKSRPKYTNSNGIYLYFQIGENGKSKNLRFRVQYYGSDWIFFRKVYFSVDGTQYTFIPSNKKREHSGGQVWEWFDDSVSAVEKVLLAHLATSKSARMKLQGDTDSRVKTITKSQIKSMYQTLELYNAMQ